jgi:hypothetical protein
VYPGEAESGPFLEDSSSTPLVHPEPNPGWVEGAPQRDFQRPDKHWSDAPSPPPGRTPGSIWFTERKRLESSFRTDTKKQKKGQSRGRPIVHQRTAPLVPPRGKRMQKKSDDHFTIKFIAAFLLRMPMCIVSLIKPCKKVKAGNFTHKSRVYCLYCKIMLWSILCSSSHSRFAIVWRSECHCRHQMGVIQQTCQIGHHGVRCYYVDCTREIEILKGGRIPRCPALRHFARFFMRADLNWEDEPLRHWVLKKLYSPTSRRRARLIRTDTYSLDALIDSLNNDEFANLLPETPPADGGQGNANPDDETVKKGGHQGRLRQVSRPKEEIPL